MADPISAAGSVGRYLPSFSQSPRVSEAKASGTENDPASVDPIQKALDAETAPASATTQNTEDEQLQKAVKEVEASLSTLSNDLQFGVDKDTNIMTIKVVDSSTGKVLREYPPEEILKMAKYIRENQKSQTTGLLVDLQN